MQLEQFILESGQINMQCNILWTLESYEVGESYMGGLYYKNEQLKKCLSGIKNETDNRVLRVGCPWVHWADGLKEGAKTIRKAGAVKRCESREGQNLLDQ